MVPMSDEAGEIASYYLQKHGGDAILEIDGAVADALRAERWQEHQVLLRARLRLRRLELFDQIALRMSGGPANRSYTAALN